MRTLIPALVALVLLVTPGAARAQGPLGDTPAWLLSPALGLAIDGDGDTTLAISGALGYPLTSTLAVEGELGHLFDLAPGSGGLDSSLTTIHGSLLYFIDTEYVLTPYVAGGLGIGRFSLDAVAPPLSFKTTEIGFNLGGGVTYPLSDTMWVRGDVRFFKHIDDVPTAWRFTGGVTLRLGQ